MSFGGKEKIPRANDWAQGMRLPFPMILVFSAGSRGHWKQTKSAVALWTPSPPMLQWKRRGLEARMTDQHAGIVCRSHQLNRAKGSREELPCRVQGQRPCWGQGAKPLGSSNALVTRTAAGGIAANPDKSAQGCRTLPIASCRLRQAVQSCNQTQGDGSHPHTQARRRQSAERTEAPSSGCASIPPAHSESAAQHPSSAHFRRAKPARTPPALGKQPEYSPAEGTARVETVGIRGSRTGAVLGTAQSSNPRHRTP